MSFQRLRGRFADLRDGEGRMRTARASSGLICSIAFNVGLRLGGTGIPSGRACSRNWKMGAGPEMVWPAGLDKLLIPRGTYSR
jgi:hypothetical protein